MRSAFVHFVVEVCMCDGRGVTKREYLKWSIIMIMIIIYNTHKHIHPVKNRMKIDNKITIFMFVIYYLLVGCPYIRCMRAVCVYVGDLMIYSIWLYKSRVYNNDYI